jgi:hypothetical protein
MEALIFSAMVMTTLSDWKMINSACPKLFAGRPQDRHHRADDGGYTF